ncbi:MAG: type II 3-dehydroquinate dehydratase [Bacteroidia bacterium]
MKLLILNGPNLNLIGSREPEIYGKLGFDDAFLSWQAKYPQLELSYFQSNIEGEIIDKLQQANGDFDGIILNAGGYTHTSVSIGDAVKAIKTPVIEVHLSNVMSREDFRHISFISPSAEGIISGFGLMSYELAFFFFLNQSK